jgi:signal transduction histidine kinase
MPRRADNPLPMPPTAPPLALNPPQTALGAGWWRLRRRAGRTAVFMVVLCVAIAVLLAAFDDGAHFGAKLVYSFAIGICCWAITEGTRLAAATLVDAARRWRGVPLSDAGFASSWRGVVPAVLMCMLLGPPAGLWIADQITGNQSPSLWHWQSTNTRITMAMTVIASMASVMVLSSMERLAAARAQAEAAQRLAAENQLRLLQSQLEPHMLFNTLANLRVLIGLDAARAQGMLDHLIAFLRATLEASRAAEHPLATEFERLADYLALMQVRMGPRLQVALDLPEGLRAVPVPPLLLQPLVENCVKHGLEPQVHGGRVAVRAAREGDTLVLTVRDTGVGLSGDAATTGGGFGLGQVRQRLATLYGSRASVALEPGSDGGTLATLRLPLPTPAART